MGINTVAKSFEIADFLYTKEEIEKSAIPTDEIYEVFSKNISFGYISIHDLKTLYAQSETNWDEYTFRNYHEKVFKNLFEIGSFQRRRPKLIENDIPIISDNDEFYLLIRGQKKGPLKKDEIKNLLDTKEILLTDLISTNAGHSWSKVYQIEDFDRRNSKDSDSLPGLPRKEVFDISPENLNNGNTSIEAMTGLAYLGNIKKGKAQEREKEQNLENEIKKNNPMNVYKIVLGVSIIGIVYLGNSLRNSLKSPFNENDESKVGEQSSSNIDSISDGNNPNMHKGFNSPSEPGSGFSRGGKFEGRQLRPVRKFVPGNSFTDGQKFKDATMAPAADQSDGQSYYYNDTAPIEVDPVQSKVSKETIEGNPENTQSNDPLFNQEVDN